MALHQLSKKLANASRGYLAGEFNIVLTLAAVLFVANLAYSGYLIGFMHGREFEMSHTYTISGGSNFKIRLRLATSISLFICATGLAFRSLYGVFTSMVAILSLVFVYGWWWRVSMAFLRNLEVPDFSSVPDISHTAGLWGATWWDLLVLVIATIILVWQVAILIRVMRAPNDWFSSDGRTI